MVNKEQAEKNKDNQPPPSVSTCENTNGQTLSVWACLDDTLAKQRPKIPSNCRAIMEIQRYLESDVLERHKNPLIWWKENSYNYPYLSQLVIKRCCALATSLPCERLFSKAGNILNERRTRLSVNKLKQLLFLNTYLNN